MLIGPAVEAEVRYRQERVLLTAGKTPAPRRVLKIICSWCRKVLRNGNTRPSHGICAQCRSELEAGL